LYPAVVKILCKKFVDAGHVMDQHKIECFVATEMSNPSKTAYEFVNNSSYQQNSYNFPSPTMDKFIFKIPGFAS